MLSSALKMDSTRAIADLDRHAAELNFPVFDNANLALAAARLTVFRSDRDWIVFVEMVGFAHLELEFVDWVYAFGSCVYPEGSQGERIVLSQSPAKPLRDPVTNECQADWTLFEVVLDGEKRTFAPSRDEYAEAEITLPREAGPGSLHEADLIRFLVHKFPNRFFAADEELLTFAPNCKRVTKFIQTTDWHHPDVAREEMPSQTRSTRTLIGAIASGNAALFEPGQSNTHWRNWLDDMQKGSG